MQLHALIKKLDEIESSDRKSIFESIGQGDSYFVTWEREIHPVLCEVAMDPTQIQQLFKNIEKDAGRSGLGKAADAFKGAKDKISDVWFNKFGGMLQNSGPVQAFDQKWEDLKSSIAAKHPELAAKLAKYGEFAKNNPKLHKFLLAIGGSVAAALGVAVAGGVGAGALAVGTGAGIATGIVNIADRLLKGEKASTAIGRGATAGAVAGLTAAALAGIGNWLAGLREKSIPFGPADAGLERVSWGAKSTITGPGTEYVRTTQGFNALVRKEEAEAIRAAMAGIKSGEPGAFDTLLKVAREVNSKDYMRTMDGMVKGAWDIAKSNDSILQWVKGVTQVATAGGAGAAGAAQTKENLSESQIQELFGFTGNKVDASKLEKMWTKAGSPTDSEEVAKILAKAGVDNSIITQAFKNLGVEPPENKEPAPNDTSAETVNIKDLLPQILKLNADQQKEILALLKA